ncbi:3-isopropylmalate dehydratase large subunit [Actinomadura sp. ATCC 31491]|uniref:3-isopropylmalate dehydratase large subunit n=1 Tax=Actinomadura luzonensis TaxID=2805427 RepID=A0ABT0FJB3_9ACTN|nr:3-isopropylmalate dehydratase large subunit [Actinomadura luzonensis]MCK2212387.1 3-isopropylmalate dehydratase large subunit [Actinomadura luzonensis]
MSGLTAVERILSRRVGREVRAGDLVVSPVDLVMAQDGNAPLAIRLLTEELHADTTFDADKVVLVIDHCGPSPNDGASNLQRMMRRFCEEQGARLFDIGSGISHVVLPEAGLAVPGTFVVGSDSHSVAYGALNCLGTGMGSTDIAAAMYSGKTWLRVPASYQVNLTGRLPADTAPKDLALELIRRVGVAGATYMCLEIGGPGLASLSVDARLTICSMAIEMGAKTALMPCDELVRDYLSSRSLPAGAPQWADSDASYEKTIDIDLSEVGPLVALPHDLTRIVPVDSLNLPVQQAFVGTCTNSRLEDLRAAAGILRQRRIHPRVRMIVTPGSREVYLEALREGVIETFVQAGAVVTPPGCGPCVGTHMGIPADDETVISTANRNFRGRMGNRNASIVLGSPETVAASAVLGRVASAGSLS